MGLLLDKFPKGLIRVALRQEIESRVMVCFRWIPGGIGSWVWIGANFTVLPGITIGDGCIIGANSVLLRRTDRNEIWAGVPAKKIRNVETVQKEVELS